MFPKLSKTSKSVSDKLDTSNGNLKLTGIPSNGIPGWLHNIPGSALSSPKKADTIVSCGISRVEMSPLSLLHPNKASNINNDTFFIQYYETKKLEKFK